MIKHFVFSAAICTVALAPLSADWYVDPTQSRIGFLAFSRIHDVEGSFSTWRFDGTIPDDLKGTGSVTVKLVSVNTANKKRDAHLLNGDFFDVSRFPEAVFHIDSVRVDGQAVQLSGRLSLHGVERPISLVLHRQELAQGMELSGETTLLQKDFGMNYDSFINPIKNEVQLKMRLVLRKK